MTSNYENCIVKCKNCIAMNMCADVDACCEKTISYANAIYNNALDDLRNELKSRYNYIDKLAKKLKKGAENE